MHRLALIYGLELTGNIQPGNHTDTPHPKTVQIQQQQDLAQQQSVQSNNSAATPTSDPKRKRVDDDQWFRNVRRKVDIQRRKLEQMEEKNQQSNQELFKIFNDLQGVAKDCNINISYPELVVVGMQSDGNHSNQDKKKTTNSFLATFVFFIFKKKGLAQRSY